MNRFDGGVFLENLEWFDETGRELVHRLPENGSGEIKFGAQLTIRDSQAGVLFYKGKACDGFGPGRHTLKTANLPILTKILSIPWRGESPLRAEIYFVNLKYFTDLKWGTRSPIAFRDNELGLVRLRAHGVFNIQIVQPVLFINSMVGTMGKISTEDISSYLKKIIVSRLNDYLGEKVDTIFNLPGKYDDFSIGLQKRLISDFADFGLKLSHLYITSITPPEDVQKAIDDKGRLSVIHDMDKFLQMKAAMAMEKAATAQGEAGAGVGMGMGLMLPALFSQHNLTQNDKGKSEMVNCPDCQNSINAEARFCQYCGHQQMILNRCANCQKNLTASAKFCSRCGTPSGNRPSPVTCRKCSAENIHGAMYCNQCGEKVH